MKVFIHHKWEGRSYCLTDTDDSDWVDLTGSGLEDFYDYKTGEPISDEIIEIEKCIAEKDFDKFIELFNKFARNNNIEYYAE
jgi:hypothetical protein